jgi:hypothetical protein
LLGIHDYFSLWCYRETSLMPKAKRVVTRTGIIAEIFMVQLC